MYTVGLIGIGSIAEGYGNPDDPNSYCHIAGIIHNPQVELAAVADLDKARRDNFRAKWGALLPPGYREYASAAEMLVAEASAAEPLDIVAVCVRGPHHFAVMQEVLQAGPRAVFLEKPPTCSLAEMDAMVALAREKGIPVTVSYSRHWAPHVLRLQELVAEGLIGEVQQVVGYCGHSFLSFASHTTDLICQFAGYCPTAVFARGTVPEGDVPAGYEPEPNVDLMTIEFANGVLGTQIGVGGEHGTFYCDVIGTEGLVRAGIYIPPFARTKGGPVDLAALGMPENASVFTVAYGQIAGHLDGGPQAHCTDQEWVVVHEIGFAGIESVLTDQRVTLPNANRDRKVFANG